MCFRDGNEIVIFHEDAILPYYIVHYSAGSHSTATTPFSFPAMIAPPKSKYSSRYY